VFTIAFVASFDQEPLSGAKRKRTSGKCIVARERGIRADSFSVISWPALIDSPYLRGLHIHIAVSSSAIHESTTHPENALLLLHTRLCQERTSFWCSSSSIFIDVSTYRLLTHPTQLLYASSSPRRAQRLIVLVRAVTVRQ